MVPLEHDQSTKSSPALLRLGQLFMSALAKLIWLFLGFGVMAI
jgi:hypothetical protein